MFSTLSDREIIISATFILSSANTLNLDQSKILLFGKGLTLSPFVFNQKMTVFGVRDGGERSPLKVINNDLSEGLINDSFPFWLRII